MRRAAILVFALACPAIWAAGNRDKGEIRGTVQDASGAVVPGARVEVKGLAPGAGIHSTVSGADGSFAIHEISVGLYQVHVCLDGFLSTTLSPVMVKGSGGRAVTVVLSIGEVGCMRLGPAGSVTGVVLEGGEALEGSQVCFQRARGEEPRCVAVDLLGFYSMELERGKYDVTIRQRGTVVHAESIELQGGENWGKHFLLRKKAVGQRPQ